VNLVELKHHWDELGKANPYWAILTGSQKWELDQFFLSGDIEVARVMRYLEQLGLHVRRQRALDFGCGVGRLTQALCSHFFRCDGVDIAPSMIGEANHLNRFQERCRYHVNDAAGLPLFAESTFDFLYSNIALQHIPPTDAIRYIRDFVRVLNDGGVAVFQMPSGPTAPGHGALPDGAFRARIRPRCWWLSMSAGETARIHVSVRNLSRFTWPSGRDNPDHPPVMLGNHWLDRAGNLVCNDDGRATLPADLNPGEEVQVPLQITAPTVAGVYTLELDLVQEMISWFKLKGSQTYRMRVRVSGGPRKEQSFASDLMPSFAEAALAIHVIPKDEVIEAIEMAGGKVVDVVKDGCAGPEWRSYRYCVIRDSTRRGSPA
jgi:SAM-dependent methyltransferase